MYKLLSALTAISLLLVACGTPAGVKIAKSDERRITAPDVSPDDITTLVNGNNTFAFDLYRSLRAQDGNLVVSPFSISIALAMTYAGARGETESQMTEVMHFDLPQNRLHPAFNALDLMLEEQPEAESEDQEPMQLNIANAVWAEQTYPFLQEFLDTLALHYGAGIQLADFINAAESARKEINAWVSDRTKDKIKNLLPEGVLTSYTRMVLVNAIYFKADWLDQFDPDSTADMPFHLLDGSDITVPTMNQGMHVPYARGDGWQAVELGYVGGTAVMDILVPDQGRFEEVETGLDSGTASAMIATLQPSFVQLALPKYEFTSEFSLSDQLETLGMTDAFDSDRADFSGMTGTRELFISDVLHKAFVAVDEEGTEAAAATAVILGVTSAQPYDLTLTIDRPFIFMIRDLRNGQVLLIGRVTNPAQ